MLLSIIIPAYNAELYIGRCLASVYNTALPDNAFEVVAINDGSTDNTVELIRAYCRIHSNLTLINKNNEGVSSARNDGIKVASGDYLLFLDADDELIDDALKSVLDYLNGKKKIDMLVTRQVRNNGEREWLVDAPQLIEHKRYSGVDAFRSRYIRTNAGGGICCREFLLANGLNFPVGVKNAEDTIFFGQLQVYARSIVYYNLQLYRINQAEASVSRNTDFAELANNYVITMHSVAEVKQSLKAERENMAIFDYVVYQLLSNTMAMFIRSNNLTFIHFKKNVDLRKLLPLDVRNIHIMKKKAWLMSISYYLVYFLLWMKYRFYC